MDAYVGMSGFDGMGVKELIEPGSDKMHCLIKTVVKVGTTNWRMLTRFNKGCMMRLKCSEVPTGEYQGQNSPGLLGGRSNSITKGEKNGEKIDE
ncbi:MAG: hypothetical protein C4530_08575 [Desulfobacteraceae bacterium]|nr:MAG: hypothetical protein C4530_08575 [Desulfobacteraceae bacterium]